MSGKRHLRVRVFRDSDTEAVISLWNRVFPDPAPRNDPADSIRRKIAADRDLFFVAEEDDTVVGAVMGGYDGHRGWIYSLAVNPSARRRGVGAALMAHLEAALADRGCPKINLQILADNEEVVAFYNAGGGGDAIGHISCGCRSH